MNREQTASRPLEEDTVGEEREAYFQVHKFESADGTTYCWEENQETELTLTLEEIEELRQDIKRLPDDVIQNEVSGNGVLMGVKIPLSTERLDGFLNSIVNFISQKIKIRLTEHAKQRLKEDIAKGSDHLESRGWSSEEDVRHCVMSAKKVENARLTVNKNRVDDESVWFHCPISFAVTGTVPNGEERTLALAIVDTKERVIRIVTLL